MAAADVQKRIDELTKKLNAGEILPEKFQEEYAKLQKLLQENIYLETRVREPEQTAQQRMAEFERVARKAGAAGYVKEQASKILKEMKKEPEQYEGQDLEDVALRRATQRYKRQILPKLAGTTEYQALLPQFFGTSTIVDPQKGLVLDPRTGEIKKGTKSELFAQALKPQVVYKAAELEPVGTGAEAKLLREQAERQLRRLQNFRSAPPQESQRLLKEYQENIRRAEELEREFEKDPQYREVESAGYIVESPLAYGFGMLNTGSAAVAPLIKEVQDIVIPGVKTRPERYKQAEEGGALNQFLTNLATREGVYDQFQAQLLPPDAEVDGIAAYIAQEGAVIPSIFGLAAEIGTPTTFLGLPAEALKMAKVVGKYSPSVLKFAQAKQLDNALRAVDSNKTVKQIKKELKSEGKDITPVTLRGRAAESIADVYATEATLRMLPSDMPVAQAKKITKESPVATAVLQGLDDAASLGVAEKRIRDLGTSLRSKTIRTGKKGKEIPMLRRAYDVAEDVRNFVRVGKKPRFDADLIRRHVRAAAIRVDPDIVSETKDLIKQSYQRPLTGGELQKVATSLKGIKEYKYKNPDEVIYEAARGAVAEVLRDNFLKNIPDNMIAIGRSVVVPAEVMTKKLFSKKKSKFMEYMKRRQAYMEHTSTTTPQGRQYNLSQDAQRNIRALFDAQDTVVPFKIDEPLNAAQFNILQNKIAEDLAIELLGGIRLQQGSLTAEFARLKGAERSTLISPVSGKVSSFGLSLKGLANSLRILQPKVFSFLGKPTADMTPQMSRFMRELNEQSNRAFRQVEARLKNTKSDLDARNAEIESSLQQGLQVKLQRMETQAPRAQEAIADVSPEQIARVSDVVTPFEKQRAQKLEELESRLDYDYATREAKYEAQRENLIESQEQTRLRQLIKDAYQEGKILDEYEARYKARTEKYKKKLQELKTRQEQEVGDEAIKNLLREQELLDNYDELYAGKETKYKQQLDEMIARHDEALRIQAQGHEANLEKLKRTLESNIRRLYRDKNEIKLQRIRQEYLSKKETINNRYNRKAKEARDKYTQGLLETKVEPSLSGPVKSRSDRLLKRKQLKDVYDKSLRELQEKRMKELKEFEKNNNPLLEEAYENFQKKKLSLEEILPIIQKEKQGRIRFNNLLKKYKDIRENLIKKHLQVRNLAQHQYGRRLQNLIERQQKRMGKFEEGVAQKVQTKTARQETQTAQTLGRFGKTLQDLIERQQTRMRRFEERIAQRKAKLEKQQERSSNRQELENKRRLQDLSIRQQGQVGRFKERTAEKVEKKIQIQEEKRKAIAMRRKKQGLSDQYGRAVVDNVLESAGINTYEEMIERLDDLQNNMQTYVEAIYRGEQWRILINKFFTNPGKEYATNAASPSFYIDRLQERKLLDNTYLINPETGNTLTAGDILPVTPENLKLVIDRIRESAPELKKFGLSSNPILKNNEDYFLPILELMVDIQRTENMQQAVQRFIIEDPDLLIRVGRTYNSTAGLDAIEATASNLKSNIEFTLRNAKERGLLKETDVDLFIEQCKEILFNGAMKDIWKATGRNQQQKFLQTYLDESIKNEILIPDVNGSLINAYNDQFLNSTTFDRIRSKSETILRNLQQRLLRSDKITPETQPIIDDFIQRIPEVIEGMEQRYLFNLLGRTHGEGLFGDQVREMYGYMSRYGISAETTLNNLNVLMPKLSYVGSSNMTLLYGGDLSGVYENMQKLFKTSTFQDRLKKLSRFGTTEKKYAVSQILSSIDSILAGMGKLSIANMLYGVLKISSRFMGFNRLTAPHIYLTTIGYGQTKLQDVLKFTGVALGGGVPLVLRNVIKGLTGKTFGSFVDSNRYLYLPDDEVVIRAADTNAMRDYTAGELRQIGVDTGFEYSRAAAEFYDDQYKGLLDAMRMTPQGKMEKSFRTFGRRFLENITGQTNYLADFAHLQDAELRRQVFIQALKNGETVEDAVSLAKQVLLDYTTLNRLEKEVLSRYVRFYAFMRTMNVATINNFYRGIVGGSSGAFVPRLLRAQNTLTKETSQDFVSMTDDQRGRLYNFYAGTVDDVDIYLSGPPNPQVQAFELVSMLPLFMLGAVTDNRIMSAEEVELESAVWSTIEQVTAAAGSAALKTGFEALEAHPFVEYIIKSLSTERGAYMRPFPKEFIYAAEQQGILDDVIKRYDLVPRRRTPGRPLTEEGEYLSFRKGSAGLKGHNAYLVDRLLGAYTIPVALVGMYGKGGVQKHRIAVSTRAISEYWKMRMLEEGVQSPEFRAKYLKSATIQKDMGMFQNILGMAYQLGVVTPTSSRSKKFIVDTAMKEAQRVQQELGSRNEKQ